MSGIQKQYDDALAKLEDELNHELDNATLYSRNATAPVADKERADVTLNNENRQKGLISLDEWDARAKEIDDEAQAAYAVISSEYRRMNSEAKKRYDDQKAQLDIKRDADIAAYQAFCAGSSQSSSGSNSMTPVTDQNHTIGMCDPSKGVCSPI